MQEITRDFNVKDKELLRTLLQKEDCEKSNNELRIKNDNLEALIKKLDKEREVLNLKNEQLNSRNENLDALNAKL